MIVLCAELSVWRATYETIGRAAHPLNGPIIGRTAAVARRVPGATIRKTREITRFTRFNRARHLAEIRADAPLRIGQSIKLPNQAYLNAGRDAKNTFLKLDYFIETHHGALPPNPAHPPSFAEQFSYPSNWHHFEKNGYGFDIDPVERARRVTGMITEKAKQGRSKTSQLAAGGVDRLPTDQGGHYIARRFNGPTEAFNHFAQDGSFNRSEYRTLENLWSRETKAGKKVYVRITPSYAELSRRPSSLNIFYSFGGNSFETDLPNQKGNKNDVRNRMHNLFGNRRYRRTADRAEFGRRLLLC